MPADTKEFNPSDTVRYWIGQIGIYEQKFASFEKRGKQIIDRYRDERKNGTKKKARFNILYSNVETLAPALYATPPKPNVDRRFQDDDDLGRYSALVLERSASYFVGQTAFDKVMKQAVLDRLLPGRGLAWVRYVPVISGEEDEENLEYEEVVVDYVHWRDFGHTWARVWQEVEGAWRIVYMSRDALKKRFPSTYKEIPLDAKPYGKDDEGNDTGKKATIYEIWDKVNKKVIWLHKSVEKVLDEKDDPLRLKSFFPFPEPLYATLSNEDLIPTADYLEYQDQALELDQLTGRIASITDALKVAGVYDSNAQGIDRLLSEGVENKLIPVDQWAVFGEKGLPGVMSLLPMQEIVNTLISLYDAREKVKQDLYEITGISDIVRGSSDPRETLGAQQLKGKFATLRLDDKQKDVARFSCDLVRIITEIIAEHFSLDTIKQISGVKLLTAQEKQAIQMQMQMAQQMNPQNPPPPLPEKIEELMEMPTWEEIDRLIRNDMARCFRIDIETDSTIKVDQEAEKQARTEFLSAVGGFLQQAVIAPPSLQPLVMEMLLFGVRGFKVGREIETTFETVLSKMKKEQDNPQPNAEEMKAQAEQQRTQAQIQLQQMKSQGDLANIQAKSQADQQKSALDLEKAKLDVELKQIDIQLKLLDIQSKKEEAQDADD